MSNLFKAPFLSNIPMSSENPGYEHGMAFISDLRDGAWPSDLSGCWVNFIESDRDYTIALYFDDRHPEGTIIESSQPILSSFPNDYPDAYMSWNKQSRQIFDTYVKPTLRGRGVASAIAMLICVHTAQTSSEYMTPRPDAYNIAVSKMISRAEQTYGVRHGPLPYSYHQFNAGIVFTEFEPISLEAADKILQTP